MSVFFPGYKYNIYLNMPRKRNNRFAVNGYMKAKHQQKVLAAAEKAVLHNDIKMVQEKIRRFKDKGNYIIVYLMSGYIILSRG